MTLGNFDGWPSRLSLEEVQALAMAVPHNEDPAQEMQFVGAIHDSTSASEAGRHLLRHWASALPDEAREFVLEGWSLFPGSPNPRAGVALLCKLVEATGQSWIGVLDSAQPKFEKCSWTREYRSESTALDRYSLTGSLEEMEEAAWEQVRILGGLALTGQATVLYSAPNLGKTLLTLSGLINSILDECIKPERLYYINADDGYTGLIEKLALAEEFGFEMVGDGFKAFSAKGFLSVLAEMIEKRQCQGVVIVLDTAKKFLDPMSKSDSTDFMRLVRRFVLRGGTMILLAHVNKKPGPDGSPVYAGTSDLLEDADCAHTLQLVSAPDAKERRVLVRCIKRRGDVRQRAMFSYSGESGIPYAELLASVKEVPDEEVDGVLLVEESRSDAELIAAAEDSIRNGVCQKMKLVSAVSERAGASRRAVLAMLDRYTGTDPAQHRWQFAVRERGAKVFCLIPSGSAAPETGL